jgi:hypothetical protein
VSRELTPDEMFEALQELAEYAHEVAIHRRRREDAIGEFSRATAWYLVIPSVHIRRGAVESSFGGSGETPTAAIVATWQALTTLKPAEYLTVRDADGVERGYRWNGGRWAPVRKE